MIFGWKEWDKAILALMMWREARSEGREGMRAVGHVAKNRAMGRSLSDVIVAEAQFTSINPPGKPGVEHDPQLAVWPKAGEPRFAEAMELAEKIVDGVDDDPTHGAFYYWNPQTADQNGWFIRNVARKNLLTARIGRHEFFAGDAA